MRTVAGAILVVVGAVDAGAQTITPDDPGPADVQFTVNSTTGAKPISPYIYGVNFYGSSGFSNPVTIDRLREQYAAGPSRTADSDLGRE
jgi:hypothetical protein